jgi:4'-phosphopantetheinyl transferase
MINDKSTWQSAVPGKPLSSNDVHVWCASLDIDILQSKNLSMNLSADELARAGRFRFERDRKRFILAHAFLRVIIGRYLEINPHQLCFEYTSHGKPILSSNQGYDTLCFNMSHSNEFAIYAFARGRKVGIDVERIDANVDFEQIAQRFFSSGEIRSLESIHKNKRCELFFQYWTRKEAFIKATGKGMSFPMKQCDVSLMNGKAVSPIILSGNSRENLRWYGLDLAPVPGYIGAIAVEGNDWDVSCWEYTGF